MPERVVVLNATAAAILRRCGNGKNVEELISSLDQEFDGATLSADVRRFLAMAWWERWLI
jgi:coenzyme PQQ biosynthesis protein PqqD